MNGPEHYVRAEALLEQAARWENAIVDDERGPLAQIANTRAEAQVHATLALAAATVEAADQQIDTNYRRPLVLRATKADDIDGPFPGSPWGRAFYGDAS